MKLSYLMLDDLNLKKFMITRKNSILSRQIISEILLINNITLDKFKSSLTIQALIRSNKQSVEEQIKLYYDKIHEILN